MSGKYDIAETAKFGKDMMAPTLRPYYPKIRDFIYPLLRLNPHYGTHIKRLKGDLTGVFRYRVGNYRLFYTVDEKKKLVFILNFTNRKDAY